MLGLLCTLSLSLSTLYDRRHRPHYSNISYEGSDMILGWFINQSINIYFTQQPIGFFKNERLCLARATGVHRKSTSARSIGQRAAPDMQGHHTRGPAEQNLEEEWQGSTTRPQPEKAPASPQAITTPHTAPTAERPPRR